MKDYLPIIITIITSVFASSGFWMYLIKKHESRDTYHQLLLAVARDRIVYLGTMYIKKGTIDQDAYDNIIQLYIPYSKIDDNGYCKKIMKEIEKLPIYND